MAGDVVRRRIPYAMLNISAKAHKARITRSSLLNLFILRSPVVNWGRGVDSVADADWLQDEHEGLTDVRQILGNRWR